MDPKNIVAFVPKVPGTTEHLSDVWEPPFDRWLRLTEALVTVPGAPPIPLPTLHPPKP